MLRIVGAWIIYLYQKTFSPDHGPLRHIFPHGFCRFHPTCSEYTKQTMLKHGFFRGVYRGIYRILRCNPWSKGGVDLP